MLGGIGISSGTPVYGLDAPARDQLAWGGLIGGLALTAITWAIGYAVW